MISFEQYVEFERGSAYDLGREEGREEVLDGLVAAGLLTSEQAQEFLDGKGKDASAKQR